MRRRWEKLYYNKEALQLKINFPILHVSKFEQVRGDLGQGPGLGEYPSEQVWKGGPLSIPVCTDRHNWKHYLPAALLAGGNDRRKKIGRTPIRHNPSTNPIHLKSQTPNWPICSPNPIEFS